MLQAPPDWYYHLFPLEAPEREEIELDAVVRRAHAIINQAKTTGDRTHLGDVLHWAHLLKVEQAESGDWAARVNARTGEPIGQARTRSPLSLFARLNAILDSSEFDAALAYSKRPGRVSYELAKP